MLRLGTLFLFGKDSMIKLMLRKVLSSLLKDILKIKIICLGILI